MTMSDDLRAWLEEAKRKLDEATECAKASGRNANTEARWRRASWAMQYGDDLLRKCEELAGALERAEAGVWDAYYGRGISVEYARSVRAEAQSALRSPWEGGVAPRYPWHPIESDFRGDDHTPKGGGD